MLFHNHPSGNLTPSQADLNLTNRVIKAFGLLDIPVMDHIILGPERQYYSMRENGKFRIPEPEEGIKVEDLNFSLKAKTRRSRAKPREEARLRECTILRHRSNRHGRSIFYPICRARDRRRSFVFRQGHIVLKPMTHCR